MPTTDLPELHLHLDGSLRPSTVEALAAQVGVAVPADLLFSPKMGLGEALSRFRFTLSLLQQPSAVRRVAAEICEDAAQGGVTRLEIRFAPQLHGQAGCGIETIIDAALEGIADRAGLILCGLYGEDPAILRALVAAAASRPGVVGIDLAGGPSSGDAFGLEAYAPAFVAAQAAGLGRTAHVAEGRSPAEIVTAIERFDVQRVGHATTLLDDPRALERVVERGVTVEACPTSNVHTGVIDRVAAHPVARWLARGVRVCICSDNPLLSDTTTARELARVRREVPGIGDAELEALKRHGHAAAFGVRPAP